MAPKPTVQREAPATMRWKLFAATAVAVIGVAILSLLLARDAVRRFVRQDEIERVREGPLVELKQRCRDYLADRDRLRVEKLMAALVAKHDQLAYICFVDSDLVDSDPVDGDPAGHGLLSSTAETAPALLALAQDPRPVPPEGRVRRVGGETVIDVTETTTTKPAYTLHLGLRRAAIDERTGSLLTKMTLIAGVIAGGGLAVAFGLIVLIITPLEKLAADASRLSLGDMRVTFTPRGRGEIGRLTDAIERLKESVLCGLKRSAPRPTTPMRGPAAGDASTRRAPADNTQAGAGKK